MTADRRTTRRVARVAAAAFAAAATAGALAQVATAEPAPPTVPATIEVGAPNKVFLVAHAEGVQIWSCNVTPAGFVWGFVAPRADLYDDAHKLIGTHFAGPTWQARDGSSIKAARVDGVTIDATAIPWLKLKAHTPLVGADGDRLAGTTFIQRVATVGGIAPGAAACNADSAGTVEEVPYTADYYFWKAPSA